MGYELFDRDQGTSQGNCAGHPKRAYRVEAITVSHPAAMAGAQQPLPRGFFSAAEVTKSPFHLLGRRPGRSQARGKARQRNYPVRERLWHTDETGRHHQWRHRYATHLADDFGVPAVLKQRIIGRDCGPPSRAAQCPGFVPYPALDDAVPSLRLDHKKPVTATHDMIDLMGGIAKGHGEIGHHGIPSPAQGPRHTLFAALTVAHVTVRAAFFSAAEP